MGGRVGGRKQDWLAPDTRPGFVQVSASPAEMSALRSRCTTIQTLHQSLLGEMEGGQFKRSSEAAASLNLGAAGESGCTESQSGTVSEIGNFLRWKFAQAGNCKASRWRRSSHLWSSWSPCEKVPALPEINCSLPSATLLAATTGMSTTLFRAAAARTLSSSLSARALSSTAVTRRDLVQELYLSQLKSYKPAPVDKDAHVGVVKPFAAPSQPQPPPLPSNIAADLAAYDTAEPQLAEQVVQKSAVEGAAGGGALEYLAFLEEDIPEEHREAH